MSGIEVIIDPYYQPGGKRPGEKKILRISNNKDENGNLLVKIRDHLLFPCLRDKYIRCVVVDLSLTKKEKTDITIVPFDSSVILGKVGDCKITVLQSKIRCNK